MLLLNKVGIDRHNTIRERDVDFLFLNLLLEQIIQIGGNNLAFLIHHRRSAVAFASIAVGYYELMQVILLLNAIEFSVGVWAANTLQTTIIYAWGFSEAHL